MAAQSILLKGGTVLGNENGKQVLLFGADVLIKGDKISKVGRSLAENGAKVVDCDGMLVLPGLINLHNHCVTTAACRGMTDDINRAQYKGTLLFTRVFPLKRILMDTLADDELRALLKSNIYELINFGTTCLLEQCTNARDVDLICELALEAGLRLNLGRYITSGKALPEDKGGKIQFEQVSDAEKRVRDSVRDFERLNGLGDGMVTVWLVPHAPDTCSPDLLKEVRRVADDTGMRITTHMAQVRVEMEIIKEKYGCTPTEYFERTGLLGDDLVVAHATFASAGDRKLMKQTGTHLAHCPLVFAKGGIMVPLAEMMEDGVNVGIGTDSYAGDMLAEMRAAALVGKMKIGVSHAVTAEMVVRAATLGGAKALGRDDLGKIEPGAKADVVAVDMRKPHIGPVYYPLVNLVYHALGYDVKHVVVNGRFVKEDGRVLAWDEEEVIRGAEKVMGKVWAQAEKEGILKGPGMVE